MSADFGLYVPQNRRLGAFSRNFNSSPWGTGSKKISCSTLTLKRYMPTKDRKEDQRVKPGESRKNKENRTRLKHGYHQQVKAYTLQFSRFSSLNFPFWVNLASVPMQPAFEVFWVFFSLSSSFYFTYLNLFFCVEWSLSWINRICPHSVEWTWQDKGRVNWTDRMIVSKIGWCNNVCFVL